MAIWWLALLWMGALHHGECLKCLKMGRMRGLSMRDQSKPMSPALERRVEAGTISSNDLERAFAPNKKEIDRLSLPSSQGFATFIFGLEGCLVDLDALYYQAYAMMASTANLEMPSKASLRDSIGSTFAETILAFGWDLPPTFDSVFFETMERLMERSAMGNRMTIQPGAVLALETCIQGGNTIIINTALPRKLATKILGSTQLSTLLAANVNPENLIHSVTAGEEKGVGRGNNKLTSIGTAAGGGTRTAVVDGRQQLIRCCAQARSAPLLGMLVDVNRRNLLQAKRVGLSTVGVSDYAINKAAMNSCDKVLRSLLDFKIKDVYSVVRRHVEMSSGMKEATSSAATMVPPEARRQIVASPAEDDPRALRDTFAEDRKSPDVL
jgi:hypothetical protein